MLRLDEMEVASLASMPVGVVLWNSPEPGLTVVTKVTLALGPGGAGIAGEGAPFHAEEPSLSGCPWELHHPGDLAPRKARCDVLLTGSAYAPEPSAVIGASLRIGTLVKRFFALAAEPAEAIPLSLDYLRHGPSPDAAPVTVGPMSAAHPGRARFHGVHVGSPAELAGQVLPLDFDFAFWNSAPPDQQLSALSPGMAFSLRGLAPGGAPIQGQLPTRWPRVFVPDDRRGRGLREIPLVCDTLWIDTDRALAELTFRGTLVLGEHGRLPACLVATLGEAFERPDPAEIEAQLRRAPRRPAVRPGDIAGAAPGIEGPEEIEPDEAEIAPDEPEIEPDDTPVDPAAASPGPGQGAAPPAPGPAPRLALSSGPLPLGQLGQMRLAGRPAPPPPLERPPADDEVTQLHAGARRAPAPRPPAFDRPAPEDLTLTGAVLPTSALPFARGRETPAPRAPAAGGLPFTQAGESPVPGAAPAAGALPFSRGGESPVPGGAPGAGALPFSRGGESPVPGAAPGAGALPFSRGGESPVPGAAPGAGALPFSPRRTLVLDGSPVPAALPFGERAGLQAPSPPSPTSSAPPVFGFPERTAPPPETLVPPRPNTLVLPPPDTLVPPRPNTLVLPPADSPVVPAATAPKTLVPPPAALLDGPVPRAPTLPFAAAVPAAVAPAPGPVLGLGQPAPMDQWTTMDPGDPRAPPPWAAALAGAGASGTAEAPPPAASPVTKLGLFSLEQDAAIQLALWEGAERLHEALARHGVDELTWLEHRRLRDEELRAEAKNGGFTKALAAHEALENARRGAPGSGRPSLDLEAYAELRAALRDRDDPHALLASRGIDLARWERDHRWYRNQLRKDASLAERFFALSSGATPDRPPSAHRPAAPPGRPAPGTLGHLPLSTPDKASPATPDKASPAASAPDTRAHSPSSTPGGPPSKPAKPPRRRSARMAGRPRPNDAPSPAPPEGGGARRHGIPPA